MRERAARPLTIGTIVALCISAALAGCMQGTNGMSAQKAFALSASALAGSDRYGVAGEVAIFDPNGVMAGKSRYEGLVTGHGNFNLKWSDRSGAVRTRGAKGKASQPAFQPLQLLSEVEHGKATVTYTDNPYSDGNVRLLVKLNKDAAKRIIADGLRAEIRGLRSGLTGKSLKPRQRKEAEAVLIRADRHLNEALSTLKVSTVCLWTADRDTWFPRQMREETELAYQWNGKAFREKRVSETHFLHGDANDTMGRNR